MRWLLRRGHLTPTSSAPTPLSTLLAAVAKGKGKGKGQNEGQGKGGKRQQQQPQQGSPQNPDLQLPPGVSAPRNFRTGCWRCGGLNHSRQQRPKYAAAVAQARAQAKAGGGVRELGADAQPPADAPDALSCSLGQLDDDAQEPEKALGIAQRPAEIPLRNAFAALEVAEAGDEPF
eukprot:3289844-Alexandrium_andersonii.AAC.1